MMCRKILLTFFAMIVYMGCDSTPQSNKASLNSLSITANNPSTKDAFIQSFLNAQPGVQFRDINLPDNWWKSALIQTIGPQSGSWFVWVEEGSTVFRIYPDLDESEGERTGGFTCVVVKVNGDQIVDDDLIEATKGTGGLNFEVIEYAVHVPGKKSIHRTIKESGQQ